MVFNERKLKAITFDDANIYSTYNFITMQMFFQ